MARRSSSLVERWRRQLPEPVRSAVRTVLSLAERRGVAVLLVGGAVRDLLLGVPHVDLDLVVEGDAIGLAAQAAKQLRARAVAHPRFGTAALENAGFSIDLARARSERYERPGALPAVQFAELVDDLARRDFTINAMALRLTDGEPGELIDPHGGDDDLARGVVRVLHDDSFRDDATRILRAQRYAGRLGFRLERHTAALLRRDLAYLDTISGARLRHEFERIAQEERVARIVRSADRVGALAVIHPALRPSDRALRAVSRLPRLAAAHRDGVLFCVLLADAPPRDAEAAIARLAPTGRQAKAVRGYLALRAAEAKLARPSLRPSAAVRLLSQRAIEAVEAFALLATRPLAADRARRYLKHWRFVRPRLNGRDVEALGLLRGPKIGAALAALHEARLDGRAKTRKDEEALVRKMLSGRRTAKARRG